MRPKDSHYGNFVHLSSTSRLCIEETSDTKSLMHCHDSLPRKHTTHLWKTNFRRLKWNRPLHLLILRTVCFFWNKTSVHHFNLSLRPREQSKRRRLCHNSSKPMQQTSSVKLELKSLRRLKHRLLSAKKKSLYDAHTLTEHCRSSWQSHCDNRILPRSTIPRYLVTQDSVACTTQCDKIRSIITWHLTCTKPSIVASAVRKTAKTQNTNVAFTNSQQHALWNLLRWTA